MDLLFDHIRDLVHQPFAFFPAQTGIRDGLAVAVFADPAAAGFDVAFDHKSLYQTTDVIRVAAAVQDFLGNTHLFGVLLVGIGVVGIYDAGWILKISLGVEIAEKLKILVVVVGAALASLVHCAPKDYVGQRIAGAAYLIATEDKVVGELGSNNRV